jgi:hypothetical protein
MAATAGGTVRDDVRPGLIADPDRPRTVCGVLHRLVCLRSSVMSALIHPRPFPEEEFAARAAGRRARAVDLRWAARCEEMEAVLDDLAAALLPRPDVTYVVGYACEGMDCRYDKGFTPTDHDIFPHLHLDAVVCTAADGGLVLVDGAGVPSAVRGADLEEDHEGIHPESRGWQVGAPYRTVPPAGLDEVAEGVPEVDAVWLDAAALRARIVDPAT